MIRKLAWNNLSSLMSSGLLNPNVRLNDGGYRLQSHNAGSISDVTSSLQQKVRHWPVPNSGCNQKNREPIRLFKTQGIKSRSLVIVSMEENLNAFRAIDTCSYLFSGTEATLASGYPCVLSSNHTALQVISQAPTFLPYRVYFQTSSRGTALCAHNIMEGFGSCSVDMCQVLTTVES